jgi:hypothetical protein
MRRIVDPWNQSRRGCDCNFHAASGWAAPSLWVARSGIEAMHAVLCVIAVSGSADDVQGGCNVRRAPVQP